VIFSWLDGFVKFSSFFLQGNEFVGGF